MNTLTTLRLLKPTNDRCYGCESDRTVGVIDSTPNFELSLQGLVELELGFELAFCERCREQVIAEAFGLVMQSFQDWLPMLTFLLPEHFDNCYECSSYKPVCGFKTFENGEEFEAWNLCPLCLTSSFDPASRWLCLSEATKNHHHVELLVFDEAQEPVTEKKS